ncbi:putative tail completion protein [Acinetobacter phage vB_AbaP_Alexa]|nr:putative tail completion protein [Acinetobacter phage vB_AbaP_Alexa]
MADALIETDLLGLCEAIEAKLSEAFPDFKVVQFFREEEERAPLKEPELPALLLEVSELEPNPEGDPGTEQLSVIARFEARVVVNFRTVKGKIEAAKIAGAVAAFMHKERHFHRVKGCPVTVDAIVSDAFYPDLDRFNVWRVDFSCIAWLGESVWTSDGTTPGEPVYSWVPKIGPGNESEYEGV